MPFGTISLTLDPLLRITKPGRADVLTVLLVAVVLASWRVAWRTGELVCLRVCVLAGLRSCTLARMHACSPARLRACALARFRACALVRLRACTLARLLARFRACDEHPCCKPGLHFMSLRFGLFYAPVLIKICGE